MMFSLETFRKMIKSYVYYTDYDDFAILDAYNHLEKTEKGYRTNILGLKIWIDETNEIYNCCTRFMVNPPKNIYGVDNIYLNQKIKEIYGDEYV